jgi:hypothetical protein
MSKKDEDNELELMKAALAFTWSAIAFGVALGLIAIFA